MQNDWLLWAGWSGISLLVDEVIPHDVEQSLVLVKHVQVGQRGIDQCSSHAGDVIKVCGFRLFIKLL